MSFKGTYKGDLEEIEFIKHFNKNKDNFSLYLSECLDDNQYDNVWMIRVTTRQLSTLSNRKVFTRADSYLIRITIDISDLLRNNDFYLSEDILIKNNIKYSKIINSGVSIKMSNSSSYQILKLQPNSFNNIFKSYELGAGASLYCSRENELNKNLSLMEGWNTSPEKMSIFFKPLINNNVEFYLDKEICTNIKKYSCEKIASEINSSEEIQRIIFNGIGIYNEPYSAHYFYQNGILKILDNIPFYVTTGSGRSRGDYTIVLKPRRL